MASSYPGGIDSFPTNHVDDSGEVIHAQTTNDLADAVNKIETELGVTPKGGSASVAARFTRHFGFTSATSTSYTADASAAAIHKVSFGSAPTLNAPTNMSTQQMPLVFDLNNTSGGALSVTFNAIFKTTGALSIAAGKRRTVTFYYDGSNWVELNRAAADI